MFPAIKIKTIKQPPGLSPRKTAREEKKDDGPPTARKEKPPMGRLTQFDMVMGHEYTCPIYKHTQRLRGTYGNYEGTAIDYIKMDSEVAVGKWVKRSVALLLDIERIYE